MPEFVICNVIRQNALGVDTNTYFFNPIKNNREITLSIKINKNFIMETAKEAANEDVRRRMSTASKCGYPNATTACLFCDVLQPNMIRR